MPSLSSAPRRNVVYTPTPIGPIRLDFGYGEEGGRTHFSIGHAF